MMTLVAQRLDVGDPEPRWMTYPELGEAFRITAASAKRLAIRRRWPKRPGNDGRARVAVPVEAIPVRVPGDDAGDDTGGVTSDDTGAVTAAVTALERQIERLEAEVAVMTQRATERDQLAAQVEALQMVLIVERQRTDEWKAVADRFAALAERRRPWWPWRRAG